MSTSSSNPTEPTTPVSVPTKTPVRMRETTLVMIAGVDNPVRIERGLKSYAFDAVSPVGFEHITALYNQLGAQIAKKAIGHFGVQKLIAGITNGHSVPMGRAQVTLVDRRDGRTLRHRLGTICFAFRYMDPWWGAYRLLQLHGMKLQDEPEGGDATPGLRNELELEYFESKNGGGSGGGQKWHRPELIDREPFGVVAIQSVAPCVEIPGAWSEIDADHPPDLYHPGVGLPEGK